MRSISFNYYLNKFQTMKVLHSRLIETSDVTKKLLANKPYYDSIERDVEVPWWFVGILHYMEANLNMDKQILNGQPWKKSTRQNGKTFGPYPSWHQSAIDALQNDKIIGISNWSIANTLRLAEVYNGLGYANRELDSPYLWAGTNHEIIGKFDSDGEFNEKLKSKQIGFAPILAQLIKLNKVSFVDSLYPFLYDPAGFRVSGVNVKLQAFLNTLISDNDLPVERLAEDGWLGPLSSEAVFRAFGFYLKNDSRNG